MSIKGKLYVEKLAVFVYDFKMKNICFLAIIVILVSSCVTNRIPGWVSDPPQDDDVSIYIVGYGRGDNLEAQTDKSFISVIDQLFSRFEIPDNEYLRTAIYDLLADSYSKNISDFNSKLSILDRWNSDSEQYILVRISRSYFTPIISIYTDRFNEMMNYSHSSETEGDEYLLSGQIYKAYSSYIEALSFMLSQEDEFYSQSILSVIEKLYTIIESIDFKLLETFESLTIDYPVEVRLFFELLTNSDNESYNGFLYELTFEEGWTPRLRKVLIPVRDNSIEFIPPKPLKSGTVTVKSQLNLDPLFDSFIPWQQSHSLGRYLNEFEENLNRLVEDSVITLDYTIGSDIQGLPKLISFNNSMVLEGVSRFLLEKEIPGDISPLFLGEETLFTYLREVDRITDGGYVYLILGDDILEEVEAVEDQVLIKLSGSISLVDIGNGKVLKTEKVYSEYLGEPGNESFAYLDYGLEAGELIYNLKF